MKNAPNMIMRKSTGLAARTTWKRKENQFFIFFQSAKMNSDGKKDTSTSLGISTLKSVRSDLLKCFLSRRDNACFFEPNGTMH